MEGYDYKVLYKNNRKAGKAFAIIVGKGDYVGRKSTAFTAVSKPRIAVLDTSKRRARSVCAWLKRGGAEAVWVSKCPNPSKYDGLAIPGGGDVNPSLYGEKNRKCTNTNKRLDLLQFRAIKKFVKAGKPIIGVCRGAQVINVCFGGSLHQDIGGYHRGWHKTKIKKGSWLYKVCARSCDTYHYHHQAVKKLAKGFKVVARDSKKGTVEAIEHESLPIYGLQFHPDHMSKSGKPIAVHFKKRCMQVLKAQSS